MDDIKRQLIDEWLLKADEDLQAARVLHKSKLHAPALFHCQQAAEKAIKGFLCACDFPLERTHDIVHLLELAETRDATFSSLIDSAGLLSSLGVAVRYPGAGELPPCDSTLDLATQVVDMAKAGIHRLIDGKT